MTAHGEAVPKRRLVSTRRWVPEARTPLYAELWERIRTAAVGEGAHAWRFVSADRSELYVEFLEFAGDEDPRRTPALAAALEEMERAFRAPPPAAAASEEWREIPHAP